MLRAPGRERQSSDSRAQKAKTQHSQQASGWTIFNLPPLHIGQSFLEVCSLPVLPKNSCRPTEYLIGREGDNGERRPITRDILLKQNLRIWSNKLGRNQVGHRLLSRISEMDELIYDEAKGNFISLGTWLEILYLFRKMGFSWYFLSGESGPIRSRSHVYDFGSRPRYGDLAMKDPIEQK